jgi:glycosyltransferase involved in cell wall biosynthesis
MFAPYPAVVVVSERDRQMLIRLCPDTPVVVIPNGIERTQHAPIAQVQRAPQTLLFIGNYEYAPNVDAAVYLRDVVLPQVQQQFPDAKLQLVGHAPPLELLQHKNPNVEITGRVPDVRPYLAGATVFVCPLRIGAGIKNKVLEALAMGCPVITTQIGADGIAVVHEQHTLIAPLNEFGAAVLRLLNDPQLQIHLSEQGKMLIRDQYSWGHVAERYVALYTELMTKR